VALPRVSATAVYLAALVLLGLGLRLWFIAVNDIDPRFSAADDGDYYQRALRLAATGEYLDNSWLIRPPGHVFFFAAMLKTAMILGDPPLGIAMIRGVHVALSLLLVPVGYDLARRLFSRQAGLIFATLLAVWFPLVEDGGCEYPSSRGKQPRPPAKAPKSPLRPTSRGGWAYRGALPCRSGRVRSARLCSGRGPGRGAG